MHVRWPSQENPYAGGRTDLNIVFQHFKQDCFYFDLYGVTYEQYMLSMTDGLINQTDCTIYEVDVNDSFEVNPETTVNTKSNSLPNKVDSNVQNSLSLKIQRNFALAIDNDTGGIPGNDYAIPNKTRDFLFQETGDFHFIGSDREPVNIDSVEQCISITDKIRGTKKTYYRQARFCIKSGLNLQSWEHYFQHYPHQILPQYLKFGFPIFIDDPGGLRHTYIFF